MKLSKVQARTNLVKEHTKVLPSRTSTKKRRSKPNKISRDYKNTKGSKDREERRGRLMRKGNRRLRWIDRRERVLGGSTGFKV